MKLRHAYLALMVLLVAGGILFSVPPTESQAAVCNPAKNPKYGNECRGKKGCKRGNRPVHPGECCSPGKWSWWDAPVCRYRCTDGCDCDPKCKNKGKSPSGPSNPSNPSNPTKPKPKPTPTPKILTTVPTVTPIDHGAGKSCDSGGAQFVPDPLSRTGSWISPQTASRILGGGYTCGLNGTWIVLEPWVKGWSVPARPVLLEHGGKDAVGIQVRPPTAGRKIVCRKWSAPVQQTLNIKTIAVKTIFKAQSEANIQGFWQNIYEGAVSGGKSPACIQKSGSNLSSQTSVLNFMQSRNEVADPGTYTVTVRACTNEPIGTRVACHEISSGPELIMYATMSAVLD